MAATITLLFKASYPGNFTVTADLLGVPDYFKIDDTEISIDLVYESTPPDLELDAPAQILLSDDSLVEPLVVSVSQSTLSFADNVELVGTYPQGLQINEAKAHIGDNTIHCETVPQIRCQFIQLAPDQTIELVVGATGATTGSQNLEWQVNASNANPDFEPTMASSQIIEVQSTDVLQDMIDAMKPARSIGYNSSYSWLTLPPGYYHGNIDAGYRTVRLFGSDETGGTTLIGRNPELALIRNMAVGSSVEDINFVVQGVVAHYGSRSAYARESKVANNSFRPKRTLDAEELEKNITTLIELHVPDGYSYGSMVVENNDFVDFGEVQTRNCESLIDLPTQTLDYFRYNRFDNVDCNYTFR